MPKFEVEFYETDTGEQPARNFLLSLDIKMRAKISMTISILQENGYKLREPYSKHLTDGIFELRAKVGSNISRVLYFFYFGIKLFLQMDLSRKLLKLLQKKLKRPKIIVEITFKERRADNERKI